MNQHNVANTLRVIILSCILSTAIGYSLADWAPPPLCGAPPCGNTPPPINVGAAPQMRDGMLFLNDRLYAKKAETQSTVGAVGCVPGPGCDSGTTLTTKDYVDGQVSGGLLSYEMINAGNWATYTRSHTGLVEINFSGCVHEAGRSNIGWRYYVNGGAVNGAGPALVDFQVGWCPTYTYFLNATGNFTVTSGFWGAAFLYSEITIKKYK